MHTEVVVLVRMANGDDIYTSGNGDGVYTSGDGAHDSREQLCDRVA